MDDDGHAAVAGPAARRVVGGQRSLVGVPGGREARAGDVLGEEELQDGRRAGGRQLPVGAVEPPAGTLSVWPSTVSWFSSERSVGATAERTLRPSGIRLASPASKSTRSETMSTTSPSSRSSKCTASCRPLALSALVSLVRTSVSWSRAVLSPLPDPVPPEARVVGWVTMSLVTWGATGAMAWMAESTEVPSRMPWVWLVMAGAPKSCWRPEERASSFCWSTWLIAKRTMNRAMSSVIMSA
nr:hypothetical protein [Phycicoccus sp. HDW14]